MICCKWRLGGQVCVGESRRRSRTPPLLLQKKREREREKERKRGSTLLRWDHHHQKGLRYQLVRCFVDHCLTNERRGNIEGPTIDLFPLPLQSVIVRRKEVVVVINTTTPDAEIEGFRSHNRSQQCHSLAGKSPMASRTLSLPSTRLDTPAAASLPPTLKRKKRR